MQRSEKMKKVFSFVNSVVTKFPHPKSKKTQPTPVNESKNMHALKHFTLNQLMSQVAPAADIVTTFQRKETLLNKSTSYTTERFSADMTFPSAYLDQSACKLLSNAQPDTFDNLPPVESYPEPFDDEELTQQIDRYLALILDVLNNKLAQKPYEDISDRENVTERQHALQAAKIAILLGMPLNYVLALLLHDIARPSVDDAEYGHKNHCKEGDEILLPLGLPRYAYGHAVPKFALAKHCELYRQELISPVSLKSLKTQKATLQEQMDVFKDLDGDELGREMYLFIFMRLIDDMSKVPEWILTQMRDGLAPDYLTDKTILNMMKTQMVDRLTLLKKQSHDQNETVENVKAWLNRSTQLLSRAQAHTNNPSLYNEPTPPRPRMRA